MPLRYLHPKGVVTVSQIAIEAEYMECSFLSITSILKVLLKQHKSPTGPNKFSRGITLTKADQRVPEVELDLYHVDTNSSKEIQVIIL